MKRVHKSSGSQKPLDFCDSWWYVPTSPSPDGLLLLIQQAREHYREPPGKRKRGKPRTYSGLSFLLLAVVAVSLRTFKGAELH